LDYKKLVTANIQEGGKRWAEELRAKEDRNKIGTPLFSLPFY
jgi:hypothetical protein